MRMPGRSCTGPDCGVGRLRKNVVNDCSFVPFHLPISLEVIRRREVILNFHDVANILEELRRLATAIVRYMLFSRTVVEYPTVNEVRCRFCCCCYLHWDCIS